MQTFKHSGFIKRDYETTNVVFAQAESAPSEHFIPCEESEIAAIGANQLWVEYPNGIRTSFFGFL